MKLFNWKYRYFKKKIRGVEKLILDLEFKRFKTQEIREEIRQEYDNLKSKLSILDAKIKSEENSNTIGLDELEKLKDQKVLIERDIERFTKQMEGLDLEVKGSKPTEEHPDGVQGINDQLDALRELQQMVKSYIKGL